MSKEQKRANRQPQLERDCKICQRRLRALCQKWAEAKEYYDDMVMCDWVPLAYETQHLLGQVAREVQAVLDAPRKRKPRRGVRFRLKAWLRARRR